ncbi:MAG TPA: phosphopantetheine-binding protein, partial [Pyrinomonadaceae bacterium]
LGRMDHQVKVRGYRIELGEIEAVLSRHEAVRACVVVARDEGADKRLVAYVAAQPAGPAFDLTEMRAHLRAALPEYMVPAALVVLAELPLTPNGKVDRKALPEPEQARPELKNTYVAPRTPLEETLVGIWAEVLRVERVGVEDNFFELGGHSLLATQLLARVRETLHVDVVLRSVFETPTVAGLARVIEQNQNQPSNGAPKIQARPRGRQNLQHMLAKLEQMAEGEARDLLNERKPLQ